MSSLFRWFLGLMFVVSLAWIQFLVVRIVPGEAALAQTYGRHSIFELLRQPSVYLWLWINILVGWNFWPWRQRGYVSRRVTTLLWISVGLWLGFAWGWGWFHHLRSPDPWYTHHISWLQHFVREGLVPVSIAFSVVSALLFTMSIWATWIWIRRSQLRISWFWPGLGWFVAWAVLIFWCIPHLSSMMWLLSVVGGWWLLQSVLLITFPQPRLVSSAQGIPGPGWKDLDDAIRDQHVSPTPFSALFLPILAVIFAHIATYLGWLASPALTPTSTSWLASPDAMFAQWHHHDQTHQTLFNHIIHLSWLCLLGGLPGIVILGLRYRAIFFAMRTVYLRILLVSIPVGLGFVALAFLYLHTARELVFSNHPSEAYTMLHSLQRYRQVPLPTPLLNDWEKVASPLERHHLHDLAWFPLPLVRLGEQHTMVHVSERWISVSRGWHTQRIPCSRLHTQTTIPQNPPLTPEQQQMQQDLNQLNRVLKKNATAQHKALHGFAKTRVFLILAPHTPNTVVYWVFKAMKQQGFVQIFLIMGTSRLWFHGNMQLPFLSSVQFIPLMLASHSLHRNSIRSSPPNTTSTRSIQIPLSPHHVAHTWTTKLVGLHPEQRLATRLRFVPQP